MIVHCVPEDTVGAYIAPEGCKRVNAISCPKLTSLTLPEGCKWVESYNCPLLASLTVPNGCEVVDAINCPALTSLTVSKGCEVVNVYDCAFLTSIAISNGCKTVNVYSCPNLPCLYRDNRGYVLLEAHGRYYAGCRAFTAKQAIRHWGAKCYPDQERGAAFVEAVRKNERERT